MNKFRKLMRNGINREWCAIYGCSMVAYFMIWLLYLQNAWKMIFSDNIVLHILATVIIDIGISIGLAINSSMIEYGLYGERVKK